MGRLRAYGNAIVPWLARDFILSKPGGDMPFIIVDEASDMTEEMWESMQDRVSKFSLDPGAANYVFVGAGPSPDTHGVKDEANVVFDL